MKVNVKRASDKRVPEENDRPNTPNTTNFLATPSQGQKNRKPRDSFAVMRIRSHKHSVGITIPKK